LKSEEFLPSKETYTVSLPAFSFTRITIDNGSSLQTKDPKTTLLGYLYIVVSKDEGTLCKVWNHVEDDFIAFLAFFW
jgi:hypothetical protein